MNNKNTCNFKVKDDQMQAVLEKLLEFYLGQPHISMEDARDRREEVSTEDGGLLLFRLLWPLLI